MIGSSPDSRTPRSSVSARAGSRSHMASATAKEPRLPWPTTTASTCRAVIFCPRSTGALAATCATFSAMPGTSRPARDRIASTAPASAVRPWWRNSAATRLCHSLVAHSRGGTTSMRPPAALMTLASCWRRPVALASSTTVASGGETSSSRASALPVSAGSASELPDGQLPDLRTGSLFGSPRVVVVREAEALPADTGKALARELEGSPPDATVVLLASATGRLQQLAKVIKAAGGRIDVVPPREWAIKEWQSLVAAEFRHHGRTADAGAVEAILSRSTGCTCAASLGRREGHRAGRRRACLLYTSPSPR